MGNKKELAAWVVSIEWDQFGRTYVRLYADAPRWARDHAADLFGNGIVFLRSEQVRHQAA